MYVGTHKKPPSDHSVENIRVFQNKFESNENHDAEPQETFTRHDDDKTTLF